MSPLYKYPFIVKNFCKRVNHCHFRVFSLDCPATRSANFVCTFLACLPFQKCRGTDKSVGLFEGRAVGHKLNLNGKAFGLIQMRFKDGNPADSIRFRSAIHQPGPIGMSSPGRQAGDKTPSLTHY